MSNAGENEIPESFVNSFVENKTDTSDGSSGDARSGGGKGGDDAKYKETATVQTSPHCIRYATRDQKLPAPQSPSPAPSKKARGHCLTSIRIAKIARKSWNSEIILCWVETC